MKFDQFVDAVNDLWRELGDSERSRPVVVADDTQMLFDVLRIDFVQETGCIHVWQDTKPRDLTRKRAKGRKT